MFNDENEKDDPIDLSFPFPGKICFSIRRKDDRKDLKDDHKNIKDDPKDTV